MNVMFFLNLQIENYKSTIVNDINQLVQTLQSLKKDDVEEILLKVLLIWKFSSRHQGFGKRKWPFLLLTSYSRYFHV